MLFSTESVVTERVEADGRRLVCVEWLGNGRPIQNVLRLENFCRAKKGLVATYGYEDCCAMLVIVDIALCGFVGSIRVDRYDLYAARLNS